MAHEKNSQAAFRAGVTELLPGLWRFALSLSGRADAADDLTQMTLLRAWERLDQLTDPSGLRRWTFTICRTVWLNEVRANAVRKTLSLDALDAFEPAAISPGSETNILAREVLVKMMGLPEAQRSVAMLVLVEGYAYRDVAAILDIPIGTVMSRLSAARRHLRSFVDSDAPGQEAGE